MAQSFHPVPTDTDAAVALAQQALAQSQGTAVGSGKAETEASNELAQSLTFLQNVIERNATELTRLETEMKEKRESLQSVFENDQELSTAEDLATEATTALKEQRAKLQTNPQVSSLKVQLKELSEQKKEIEDTLSNHLINYYGITQSTSFDTSEGDQWDFSIKARVKPKKS